MANTKLSALPELAATPADDDEIYIRDISEPASDESKRITVTNLKAAAVSDAAYGAGWDSVTTIAPSKNVVYDKIETLGGGRLVLIGTVVASGSASLTITGLDSTYDTYLIAVSDVVPAQDAQDLLFRVGDAGGVDSGGTDYAFHYMQVTEGSSSYAGVGSASDNAIIVATGIGFAAGEGVGAVLWLHRPGDGTTQPIISGTYTRLGTDTSIKGGISIGRRKAVITLDRVNISMSSGNIATGRLTVWGLKHD